MMSGSSFSSWSLVEDPVHYAVKVANSLNCSVPTNMMKNHQDIVKCLREKPLSDLMSVDVKAPSFLTAMGPSRDGVLIPSDFGTSSIHIRFIKFPSSSFLDVGIFFGALYAATLHFTYLWGPCHKKTITSKEVFMLRHYAGQSLRTRKSALRA